MPETERKNEALLRYSDLIRKGEEDGTYPLELDTRLKALEAQAKEHGATDVDFLVLDLEFLPEDIRADVLRNTAQEILLQNYDSDTRIQVEQQLEELYRKYGLEK